jgi:hypothetical protein
VLLEEEERRRDAEIIEEAESEADGDEKLSKPENMSDNSFEGPAASVVKAD